MSKIIGLHGVLTNGKASMKKQILDELSYTHGWLTYHPSYFLLPLLGYFSFFRRYYVNKVFRRFSDGDHIIAHSAGCTITFWLLEELQKHNRKAGNIFFINAALDRDIKFPEHTYNKIYNFYEDDDFILYVSKLVPFHNYGTMGRSGYKGSSPNVTNFTDIVPNYSKTFLRHSDFFKSPAKEKLCEFITTNTAKYTKNKKI